MSARSRKLVLFIAATALVAGCTAQQTGANSQTPAANETANAVTNNGME